MSTQRAATLEELASEWARAGIITEGQRDSLVSAHRGERLGESAVPSRTRALAFEGLGYVGGAIVIAAAVMLTLQYWADLSDVVRLAITGCAWVALLVAGAAVRVTSPTGLARRLRSVLWLAAVAAAAVVASVIGDRLALKDADLGVLVGCSAAAVAAILWWLWSAPLQQAATFVAAAGAGAALIAQQTTSDALFGLGPWAAGGAWALFGSTADGIARRLGLAAGSAMAIFGAMITAETNSGMVLLVVTLVAVAATALALGDLVMLAVGSLGIVLNVPQAADRWFPGSVAAPVALLAAGVLVIVLAVVAARRSGAKHRVGS